MSVLVLLGVLVLMGLIGVLLFVLYDATIAFLFWVAKKVIEAPVVDSSNSKEDK